MQNYFERRSEIFKTLYKSNLEEGKTQREAAAEAWADTYKSLWAEFECCYYYCKNFVLSRFTDGDVDVQEIYELVQELAAAASPLQETIVSANNTQEGFVF